MPRRPTIARKTKYAEQLTGTALTLDQFTNKLMHAPTRALNQAGDESLQQLVARIYQLGTRD